MSAYFLKCCHNNSNIKTEREKLKMCVFVGEFLFRVQETYTSPVWLVWCVSRAECDFSHVLPL